jgi:hypothetical protein
VNAPFFLFFFWFCSSDYLSLEYFCRSCLFVAIDCHFHNQHSVSFCACGNFLRGENFCQKKATMPNTMMIPTSSICYLQDSIAPFILCQNNGGTQFVRTLTNVANDVANGEIQPSSLPPIRVVTNEARSLFVTLDHRRLFVLKAANVETVEVEIVSFKDHEAEIVRKMTTVCKGLSVKVRTSAYTPDSLDSKVLRLRLHDPTELSSLQCRCLCAGSWADRRLMWSLFVCDSLKSEVMEQYRMHLMMLPRSKSSTTTLHSVPFHRCMQLSVLFPKQCADLRPGDVCVMRTDDDQLDHLVILVQGAALTRLPNGESISFSDAGTEQTGPLMPTTAVGDVKGPVCSQTASEKMPDSLAGSRPVNDAQGRTTTLKCNDIKEGQLVTFMGRIGSVTTARRQINAIHNMTEELDSLLWCEKSYFADQGQGPKPSHLHHNWDRKDLATDWCLTATDAPLNDDQSAAIRMAMTKRVSLIQGPPGTGKTYTTAVLLHTYVHMFPCSKVVAAAPSNHAAIHLGVKVVEMSKHAKNVPVCVLICDERHFEGVDAGFQKRFSRFADDVRCSFQSKHCIEAIILEKKVFFVTPSAEATLMDEAPPLLDTASHADDALIVDETQSDGQQLKEWQAHVRACCRSLDRLTAIFFSTCSGASSIAQRDSIPISMVVIDEAAKATEPDAIVAVTLLVSSTQRTLVLVGDQQQLRPHVSEGYRGSYLEVSMMERLHQRGYPHVMLTEQFRMHDDICRVVSTLTYGGRLTTADLVAKRPQFDVKGSRVEFRECAGNETKRPPSTSRLNDMEAVVVAATYCSLKQDHGRTASIAVLSPYKAQVNHLKECHGVPALTIDESQGKEYDFVVISMTAMEGDVTFLKDPRRFNVMISRAKHQLIVIGHNHVKKNIPMIGPLLRVGVTSPCDAVFQTSVGHKRARSVETEIDFRLAPFGRRVEQITC